MYVYEIYIYVYTCICYIYMCDMICVSVGVELPLRHQDKHILLYSGEWPGESCCWRWLAHAVAWWRSWLCGDHWFSFTIYPLVN